MGKEVAVTDAKEIQPAAAGDISMEALIARAIDKDVTPETMQKFLDMRNQLKAEAAKEEYFRALSAFQKECPQVKRTKIVYNKPDQNGNRTERYRYAPLDEVVPTVTPKLKKHGFSYTFTLEYQKDPEPAQVVTCTAHHIAGHEESCTFVSPVMKSDYMNMAQANATSVSYGKRYTFCNVFGIVFDIEDTDTSDIQPGSPQQQPQGKKQSEQQKQQGSRKKQDPKAEREAILKEINVLIYDDDFRGTIMYQGKKRNLDKYANDVVTQIMDNDAQLTNRDLQIGLNNIKAMLKIAKGGGRIKEEKEPEQPPETEAALNDDEIQHPGLAGDLPDDSEAEMQQTLEGIESETPGEQNGNLSE